MKIKNTSMQDKLLSTVFFLNDQILFYGGCRISVPSFLKSSDWPELKAKTRSIHIFNKMLVVNAFRLSVSSSEWIIGFIRRTGGVTDIDLTERWNVSEARKTSKNVNPFRLSAQMRIHSHASQFWFSTPNLWLGTFTSARSSSKNESFLFGSFDLFLIANSATQSRE